MATTAQNNLVRPLGVKKSLTLPVDTAGTNPFNAGDMVYLDTDHLLKPCASGAQAKFVGVAAESNQMAPYGTAIIAPRVEVIVSGVFRMKATASETLYDMDPVYVGADAQTVVKADPGFGAIVGYVLLKSGQLSMATVAGDTVEVLIVPNYPTVGLA